MLNYEYPPLGGGAARAMAHLLEQFAGQSELQIDVIASSTDSERVVRRAENVTVHLLNIGKSGSIHYQTMPELLRYSYVAWRRGKTLMENEQYDLCHAFFGIPCGLVAQPMGLPYIVSLRGSDVPFYNERFLVLDRLLFRWLSRRVWKGAGAVVANSRGLRRLSWRTAPCQQIEVIPNGVDTDKFHPDGSGQGSLRVLCVARLIPRKRIDLLIRAVVALREEGVRLTVVGEGPEEERLKALARNEGILGRVDFTGYVPHDQLPVVYRNHDVFALPSENEGMSNTALEAMASGLALIMPRTGGADELLVDGKNGVLMESGTTAQMIMALIRYCSDPALLKDHGNHSRQIAEGMSWGSVANRYERLYRAVSGNQGGLSR